jgi:hypothetical protein
VKTASEWIRQLGGVSCEGTEALVYASEATVRAIQADALEAAVAACDEVAKANLDAQDEDLDSEELSEAYGACDGAHDCAELIRRLKDSGVAMTGESRRLPSQEVDNGTSASRTVDSQAQSLPAPPTKEKS